MQCQRCSGRGSIWFDEEHYGPCPDCIGGVASCCDINMDEMSNFELPLKSGKVIKEIYTVTKEIATGYEMTYTGTQPIDPLIKEISEMILEVFYH